MQRYEDSDRTYHGFKGARKAGGADDELEWAPRRPPRRRRTRSRRSASTREDREVERSLPRTVESRETNESTATAEHPVWRRQ